MLRDLAHLCWGETRRPVLVVQLSENHVYGAGSTPRATHLPSERQFMVVDDSAVWNPTQVPIGDGPRCSTCIIALEYRPVAHGTR